MREYSIKTAYRQGEDYKTMVIIDNNTNDELAEYRLTPGQEISEIASMRRSLNRHLDNGGTIGNYQF